VQREKHISSIRTEYDDLTEEQFRMCIYSELKWIEEYHARPSGWLVKTYKELFGSAPPAYMKTIPALDARQELKDYLGEIACGEEIEFDPDTLVKEMIGTLA